ncbi:hypothetical protein [Mycobacterium sp.]|uniref:hypothetical protein n=1 Tax=Mycobacterium sp. TaxID=1785 RepID=UPI0025DA94FD|nr:hypothetical protein [Mycobacterium sp.]
MTGAHAALAILRAEIERLAAAAAAVTISTKPIRIEMSGRPPNEYSTEIWYEGNTFRVISCDGYVGLAAGPGRSLDWWPDFQVVEQNEVREIVAAMLSAHEFIVRRQEEPALDDSQPHGPT